MKAFLKTYWLELLFFAVGLVGAVIAMPFLPASVPLQFQGDGVITRTGPKWAVFIIPVVQLLVCYGFHWWIGRRLEKLPALAHTLAGMERLLRVIRDNFDLSRCVEFTVEGGRPDMLDLEKLQVIRSGGADRMSINPQTMEDSVLRAIGGVDALIDWDAQSPEIDLMRYMDDKRAKEDKLFDHPELMKTPIVRNGKQATTGYRPDVWETWE